LQNKESQAMTTKGTNGARGVPDVMPASSPEATAEPQEAQSGTSDPRILVAALQEQLQSQGTRLDEVLRAYSHLQQERDEFRKRSERERERVLEVERGKVSLALIEAIDELDRSLSSVSPEREGDPLVAGVRLIRDGLVRRLLSNGIERYETVGLPFDPTRHEAADTVEVDDPSQDGRVIEEVRAGYRQADRVLRAAHVRVGRYGGHERE
jgi:molecular chaperone GrpE